MAAELFKLLRKLDSSIQSLSCISGAIWCRLMNCEYGQIHDVLMRMDSEDVILDGIITGF